MSVININSIEAWIKYLESKDVKLYEDRIGSFVKKATLVCQVFNIDENHITNYKYIVAHDCDSLYKLEAAIKECCPELNILSENFDYAYSLNRKEKYWTVYIPATYFSFLRDKIIRLTDTLKEDMTCIRTGIIEKEFISPLEFTRRYVEV